MTSKLVVLLGTIGLAGCVSEGPTSTDQSTNAVSPNAAQFASFGRAAGKACIAQFLGESNSTSILNSSGYTPEPTSGRRHYFARSIEGGRRSIGGKDMGRTGVGLPSEPDRHGRLVCTASVSGFTEANGNAFYRAFQAEFNASSIASSVSVWGRYENNRTSIGVRYTP
ncbi:hypothetical protein OCA8868_03263 [Octadecabacter ascidiaceicola]|uniref:Lipoprotein n=1 Tax=Octadecabacter ascidiaceicola TaxID=1655543 RepID=A0A238KRB9_9RHOB|nr:hypothetical protein OCA8868_03263 [Octadecabacter ascidiaceicola]